MLPQDQRRTRAIHVARCVVSIRQVKNSSIVNNIKINKGNVYCTYLAMSIAVFLECTGQVTLSDLKNKDLQSNFPYGASFTIPVLTRAPSHESCKKNFHFPFHTKHKSSRPQVNKVIGTLGLLTRSQSFRC
jgi:hypothetical protein